MFVRKQLEVSDCCKSLESEIHCCLVIVLCILFISKIDFFRKGYIVQSLSDCHTLVIECIINSAGSQLSIVRAAEFKETRLKTIWTLVSLVLAALSAMLVTLWQKTLRQSRKIHDTADQIRKMNAMLEEAGKIKEGYVFRYINLSAKYLRLVEDYRHDLRVTLKEGGEAALREKLREPESQIQALSHKQFYSIFDETFLGIFPNFVEEVNSLLNEQARFTLKEDGELPTGLRILAAIRLGITDSGKIAEFLNCAPRSVYTHRSKIKRAAICSPEEFEKRISRV